MNVFSTLSVKFLTFNALRVLSVVAIALALSGELVVMVSDIKGYRNSLTTSTSSSSSTSAARFVRVRREEVSSSATATTAKTTTTKAITVEATPIPVASVVASLSSASAAAAAKTSSPTLTSSSNAAPAASASATTCSYVGNTSVPKTTGGIVFTTLDRIFACILLLFMLVAEMPPPTQFTQRFWDFAFPPFGSAFGVGVLGTMQVFVGCSILSKALTGLPQAAAWLLFIVGFLNILFGISFRHGLKATREIFSLPGAPSSKFRPRPMSLSQQGSPPAGSTGYYVNRDVKRAAGSSDGSAWGKKNVVRGKGIQISASMCQRAGAPPVYPSQ